MIHDWGRDWSNCPSDSPNAFGNRRKMPHSHRCWILPGVVRVDVGCNFNKSEWNWELVNVRKRAFQVEVEGCGRCRARSRELYRGISFPKSCSFPMPHITHIEANSWNAKGFGKRNWALLYLQWMCSKNRLWITPSTRRIAIVKARHLQRESFWLGRAFL